jgi:hypothetical protein
MMDDRCQVEGLYMKHVIVNLDGRSNYCIELIDNNLSGCY